MADDVIETNTATGTPLTALDAEKLPAAGPSGQDIFRERVQVTGSALSEVARVKNTPPKPTDMGLVVRELGSDRSFDMLTAILESLHRIEIYLAAMSDEHLTTPMERSDDH